MRSRRRLGVGVARGVARRRGGTLETLYPPGFGGTRRRFCQFCFAAFVVAAMGQVGSTPNGRRMMVSRLQAGGQRRARPGPRNSPPHSDRTSGPVAWVRLDPTFTSSSMRHLHSALSRGASGEGPLPKLGRGGTERMSTERCSSVLQSAGLDASRSCPPMGAHRVARPIRAAEEPAVRRRESGTAPAW